MTAAAGGPAIVPGPRGRLAAWTACALAASAAATFAQEAAAPDAATPSARARAVLAQLSAERLRRDVETLAGFGTRHVLSDTISDARGVGAARRWLRRELDAAAAASGGRMQILEQAFERALGRRSDRTGRFVNLIALLRGTDPTRGAWVAGGHYDSRNGSGLDGEGDAPGADDDASGTAVVLEMARVLATVELAADVYLCAFDGEELGLFGSDVFAQKLADDGVRVEGMITNDIVGASRGPDGADHGGVVRCFSEGIPLGFVPDRDFHNLAAENDGPSRQLARFAALIAGRELEGFSVALIYRADRFGRGGDHLSFNRRGFPAVRFTEAVEDYRHQHQNVRVEGGVPYGDLLEFVDFEYVARVARLNTAVVVHAAGAPPPPQQVRVRGAVRHDTTVEWSEVASPGLAGYRVWRRATEVSRWQESTFVPKGTHQVVLPYVCIDDHHFAVASVGADGLESPPRFPYPRAAAPAGATEPREER